MEGLRTETERTDPRKHLFYETSHSPSLADLVGYEKAKDIIDFCFIANPYYPTPEMLDDSEGELSESHQVLSLQQLGHEPEESGGGARTSIRTT